MVAPVLSLPSADPIVVAMREHTPAGAMTEPRLAAALDQAIGNPGKLVRARLVHAAAMTHGLDEDLALQLACAVEFYHIASLLLDDLPCMDDAQERRGLPCVHLVHGESTTVLASLALINRAYALAGFALAGQPMQVRLAAMGCLDACLGVPGLVGGQARDLAFADSDRSAREIGRIAAAKTGALFWLAIYFPALLAQPDAEEGRRLKALCLYWGLAFQAIDDLGDVGVAGAADALGKTAGRDEALTRPNLAHVLGVPATVRRITRLIGQADRALEELVERRPAWRYLETFHREYFVANASRIVRYTGMVKVPAPQAVAV
ncbi:polyprenyl synthetase family protein [Actomonas aquatica]|uniref:Polyprenyl synthetase family protein n=1 Tax=Actomonas aquatica TaxID=2866162 RepID=A0ABZ1C4D2_9BACT|nr:polyprenyl synthetase family protein [Opitutus sp. WL0086]WRQ86470.1 polyprenyl synthetase family protein [Opitutus sp. WL0086]